MGKSNDGCVGYGAPSHTTAQRLQHQPPSIRSIDSIDAIDGERQSTPPTDRPTLRIWPAPSHFMGMRHPSEFTPGEWSLSSLTRQASPLLKNFCHACMLAPRSHLDPSLPTRNALILNRHAVTRLHRSCSTSRHGAGTSSSSSSRSIRWRGGGRGRHVRRPRFARGGRAGPGGTQAVEREQPGKS